MMTIMGHLMVGSDFILFNCLVFILFMIIYLFMGMKKHFEVEPSLTNAAYFTTMSHATVGYGDISPKTDLAKAVVTVHIGIVWLTFAMATSLSL
jgi:hypothetical protein